MKDYSFQQKLKLVENLQKGCPENKHQYLPKLIKFDLLNNSLWQTYIENYIEAKQGHFELNRYRQHGFPTRKFCSQSK